jgi:hypothetical protein
MNIINHHRLCRRVRYRHNYVLECLVHCRSQYSVLSFLKFAYLNTSYKYAGKYLIFLFIRPVN